MRSVSRGQTPCATPRTYYNFTVAWLAGALSMLGFLGLVRMLAGVVG